MITHQRERLAHCSYQMHRDQLESHHNRLSAAHDHSLRSFHALLAGMVDGKDTSLHGKWGWGSGTGWGKSTGLCSFMRGLGSLYMLNQPGRAWNHQGHVSAIITAARIESLYELRDQMTRADKGNSAFRFPVPSHRIAVLHSDWTGKYEQSEDGKDAPIVLVAHNKLKHLAKRPSKEQEEFLFYRDQPRDLCIVDEAFSENEVGYLDQGLLCNALRTCLLNAKDSPKAHDFAPLFDTLEPLYRALKDENSRQEKLTALGYAEGMIPSPALSTDDIATLEGLVKKVNPLHQVERTLLCKFLQMIPSPLRLIRGRQSGVVTIINTMPPCLTNRIELNASFEVGMLSALDPTIKNADDHFPMLQALKTEYGLEGLAGIIDYSDMHITHLQRGGGKSTMKGHLEDLAKDSGSTKEILAFYIQAIKGTPEDEGVLVLTYKEDGVDYVEQLQRVFVQAGIDINRKIEDAEGTTQPRIAFTTYGNHVGTNKFRYCSTGILAGVQQRHKADIAGSMCGARKSIASKINFTEVDLVHQAVAASDAQQAMGRLQCRLVKNGKALPARIYVVHLDSPERTFKTRLTKAFPKAGWTDQASENRLKTSRTYDVMLKVTRYLETYQGKTVKTETVKAEITKGVLTHKRDIGSDPFSKQVWKDAIRLFLKGNSEWERQGHALIKTVDKEVTEVEEAVA
ncbi:MAG: hypothetical protein LZF60_140038 [Nitrospira sp.]|nr:MAG: hypothetical protein LZF60_140038 [Nitrospira sp.]